MATILRDWSYRYHWLYEGVTHLAAVAVGGNSRLRQLPLQGITIQPTDAVLDLCCGRGEATRFLLQRSRQVTGLDAAPAALQQARQQVPQAQYVQAWAQQMPFANGSFDLVHTSMALHELQPQVLTATLAEIARVLKPAGIFTALDFHKPHHLWLWPGLATFFWIFETETAWQLLREDLPQRLEELGLIDIRQIFHLGGSLQVIQARKP
jgi:demethylmenaquinone methyltransferase/2-methoxy-6-polyprenyl-1,4-benzoquinol methylase